MEDKYQKHFKDESEKESYFKAVLDMIVKEHLERIMQENILFAKELRIAHEAKRKSTVDEEDKTEEV